MFSRQFIRRFSSFSYKPSKLKAGSVLPDITVYENTSAEKISIREVFAGKKGILFSVPGAYTPGCSQAHIPEYITNYQQFKAEGIDVIACVAVNDPYVMKAWQEDLQANGKIRMLSDMKCEFTRAINMELDCTSLLGNIRSKRYSLIIEDGVVEHITFEPDDTGLACLLCLKRMKTGYETKLDAEERHKQHSMKQVKPP